MRLSYPCRNRPNLLLLALIGVSANLLFIAALSYPVSEIWNAWIAPWLALPAMGFLNAFGALLLVQIGRYAAAGIQFSVSPNR